MPRNLSSAVVLQSATVGCCSACLVNILARMNENHELTQEQSEALEDIYDRLLRLQKWIVFGEKE